jgi:hypothetical protein
MVATASRIRIRFGSIRGCLAGTMNTSSHQHPRSMGFTSWRSFTGSLRRSFQKRDSRTWMGLYLKLCSYVGNGIISVSVSAGRTAPFSALSIWAHAAQLPAGIDATLYDLGRMTALWVSAFEILAHPRTSKSGLSSVYPLFENATHLDPKVGRRKYLAYMGRSKKPCPRRPLPCWLYGKLYQARCDFLHGNPVRPKTLHPSDLNDSLFWLAPCLYRLALAGFLNLPPNRPDSYISYIDPQRTIERAILQTRR